MNTENTATRVLKIIAGGPSFATQSARQALEDAARSLETIAKLAGRDETLLEPDQVRGYAASRAHMARAALATPAPQQPVSAEAECKLPPTGWRCTRGAGHEGPCAAVGLPVSREWVAANPGSAAHIIYLLAKQIDAATPAPQPTVESASAQEAVGTLTVSKFRGHLENTQFDYTGSLPEGSHPLYASPHGADSAAEALLTEIRKALNASGVWHLGMDTVDVIKALVKGDARYRWLRSIDSFAEWNRVGHYAADALDEMVDAALSTQQEEQGRRP